jgi:23S rRNA (cytosine1962-C5)-methyltransferase
LQNSNQLVRDGAPVIVPLKKDLVRSIKRGHAWLFSDAVELPRAAQGSVVRLVDRSGQIVACGIYSREHPIAVRVCRTQSPWTLGDDWMIDRLETAVSLRQSVFDTSTTGYRVIAGEGDGLPGLIVDRYADVAVIKLDGGSPEDFYQPEPIARWLADRLQIARVVLRPRGRGTSAEKLYGSLPEAPVHFLENGMLLTADVIHGQKTGFFLDQRDNRALVRTLARGRDVLNLFSFSGGFSVAAGIGDAKKVTSVDAAAPAIEAAKAHWQMNNLLERSHEAVVADCFEYLEQAGKQERNWNFVICDPPSFAPSQQTLERAANAYTKLAQLAAQVVEPKGLLALASCSSHVDANMFAKWNLEGISKARRTAKLIAERGLPIDHPTPLAMPELKYLKFQLYQLN